MDTPKRYLLYEKLSRMIPILDELKAFNLPRPLSFPRIVVIGGQSAGKTSVLDSLIGFDFLPKGEGVITKRPIEIHLVNVPQEDDEKPYIVFDDRKEKKFFDFDLVRETIESMFRELRYRIAEDPIKLSLYSSSCPDLTIIDTPGICRNFYPPGNVPPDEYISKKIVQTYCRDENTLILCILPANYDLEASASLRIARETDPHGSRTIGVLTKVDIMDRGTNARRMVMGEDMPMRLGYIGLKCRSRMQRETQTIGRGLVEEKAFFRRHPVYCSMPARYFCSESLAKKISNVFLTYIIQNMKNTISDCQDKLKDLDLQYSLLDDRLWLLITKFIESLKQSLHEQDVGGTELASNLQKSGAITVRSLFSELYKIYRAAEYRSSTEYSDRDIEKVIVAFDRDDSPVFDAFWFLLPPWLEKLREPALILTDSISNFLEGETINMIEKIFSRFPQIANFIKEISIKHLKVHYEKTRKIVEQLVDSEQNLLFMTDDGTLPRRFIPCPIMGNNGLRYDPTTRNMREKLDAYFSVCCRNLGDSIPKIIGTFLVRKYQDQLQSVLFSEVKGDLLSESHNKSEAVLEKRESIIQNKIQLEKLISAIEKAAVLLEELCDPKGRASHKQDSKESLIQLVESVLEKLDNNIE